MFNSVPPSFADQAVRFGGRFRLVLLFLGLVFLLVLFLFVGLGRRFFGLGRGFFRRGGRCAGFVAGLSVAAAVPAAGGLPSPPLGAATVAAVAAGSGLNEAADAVAVASKMPAVNNRASFIALCPWFS